MTDFEKLHIEWIDYSNDEDKVNFLNALNSYLFFKKDSIDQCELLIKKNPKFNAPKLLKIVLILLSRDKHKLSIAQNLFNKISIDDVNDHFKKYLITISAWLKGDLHEVIKSLKNIISNYSKDIMAIRLLHFNSIFIGIDSNFLKTHQEILSNWSKEDPLYNLILGMTSFAYEENNELLVAKDLANESLELSKKDLWSWHALLHVQDNDLSSDLDNNKDFASINWTNFGSIKRHIWWHQALMHFYKREFTICLEMFDNFIFSEDEFYLDFCNTSSLLLRLHYQGIDVEKRMIKLKPLAEHYSNQYLIPFIDYHLVFFYKYFNDVKHLKQMEEGILLNYKNTGFKASTSKYLSPIIKSLRSTEIINEEIFNNAFQSLGGSFAQREIIMLGVLNYSDNSKLQNKIKNIFNTKKSTSINYV